MRNKISIVVASIVFLVASRAEAGLVEISFTGMLEEAVYNDPYAPNGALPGVISGIGVGQAYSGIFTFDDSAPIVGMQSGTTEYSWATGVVTLDIGGFDYSFIRYYTNPGGQVLALPTSGGTGEFGVSEAQDGDPQSNYSQMTLGFGINSSLSSLTLADVATLPLTDFVGGYGTGAVNLIESFQDTSQNFIIEAEIDTINGVLSVPEPGSLTLLGIGSLAWGPYNLMRLWKSRRNR